MERAAVVLAGGFSKRLGQDKGLVKLAGKPLVTHVLERASEVVDEVLVVVSSESQKEAYSLVVPNENKIFVDDENVRSPLIGALTGFANTRAEYSLLLPCDTPFVSGKVIELLFETCVGVDAAVPRWPNDYIEPLQAVYMTSSALDATRQALGHGEIRPLNMIRLLRRTRYLSTLVIQQLDPHLTTFFNVNTPLDLVKAEKMIEKGTVT
jgi:molybdopterin-guanine dinucleotide biosynthesis protein A